MIDRLVADRYRVTELIAHRGPVAVYEGIDRTSGQRVLVKRIPSPLADDPTFVENWQNQLRGLRAIGDVTVPTFLVSAAGIGELLQVETPPRGVSLRRHLATQPVLPSDETYSLILAIASALAPVHRTGLSHGALNPDSIYVVRNGLEPPDAYIADWELGEVASAYSETPHELPVEVARYLAPEQIGTAAPPPRPTTDVYALGLILYEMLTGDHPFGVGPGDPILARLTQAPIAPTRYNPDVPAAVERVLLLALSRDPAARPPHAGAFATALRQAIATPTIAPPPPPVILPTVVEHVPVPVRERPAWLLPVLIGLAIAALGIFSVFLAVSAGQQPAAVLTPTATLPTAQLVPSLIGLTFNDAQLLAARDDITLVMGGAQSGTGQPANTILSQDPPAGALLPATRAITVTLALEPTPIALADVPNLYAQRKDVAEQLLLQKGLRLGQTREAHSDVVPSGLVMEQNPRAGLRVDPSTTVVDIIISLGLPPTPTVAAPAVIPTVTVAPTPIDTPEPTATAEIVVLPTEALPPTFEVEPTIPVLPTEDSGEIPPLGTGPLLFQDDFSTNDAGWTTVDEVDYSGEVVDGVNSLVVFTPGTIWWSQPGREFGDFRYEADVMWTDFQDAEQGLGLVFRLQDADHFYFFEIDQLGQFRVRAREGADWRTILDWTVSDAITPGLGTNRLAVEAVGESLAFEVNGESVYQTADDAFLIGDIGVGAANDGPTTLFGQFDNVVVYGR